jgi:hypothetical protein
MSKAQRMIDLRGRRLPQERNIALVAGTAEHPVP